MGTVNEHNAAPLSLGQGCPSIIPPYLLSKLAEAGTEVYPQAARAAERTLMAGRPPRQVRPVRKNLDLEIDADGNLVASVSAAPDRTIYDAEHSESLPGVVVRREDDEEVADPAVNEAFTALGATFALLLDAFGRNSINGEGEPLLATVHYGTNYDNAFWDGERMVFGDGDGEVFLSFTRSVSVIGHELGHGVIEDTAGLKYQGQSGALNESIADVFGALTEQHLKQQSAAEASWLIGDALFAPAVTGSALRSMLHPGTAYDDDVLGTDPQPASMSGFVETTDDNGGVHINSGIPNRAFALSAIAIGGTAWEGAGAIWYRALTSGTLTPTATFREFADATVAAARAEYGEASPAVVAVTSAWEVVGVYGT